jgi:5-methyltetrahydrofolate--homocysteine methyltransferase
MICDIARQTGLPIAVNLALKYTQDRKSKQVVYRTDWGHSAANLLDVLASGQYSGGDNLLDHVHLVGINCGAETRRSEHTGMPYALHGVEQFKAAMQERGLAKKLMIYPNAGMPRLNSALRTIYSQSPEEMTMYIPDLAAAGVQIIGGCCGTTPDHIRAFRQALDS